MATDAVIYRLYVGGVLTETSPSPSFELDALTAGTYTLTVTAVDDSGNESSASGPLVVVITTPATRPGRALLGVGT